MTLKIIFDTGTWIKLDKLQQENIISNEEFSNWLSIADFYITHEIEKELQYFNIGTFQKYKNMIFVVPISNQLNYKKAIEDGYDIADSSIIGIKHIQDFYIISEDRPLIEYYSMYNLNIMFFADFIWILLNCGIINKNLAYKIIRPLQKLRNIPIKKYQRLKEKIQKF